MPLLAQYLPDAVKLWMAQLLALHAVPKLRSPWGHYGVCHDVEDGISLVDPSIEIKNVRTSACIPVKRTALDVTIASQEAVHTVWDGCATGGHRLSFHGLVVRRPPSPRHVAGACCGCARSRTQAGSLRSQELQISVDVEHRALHSAAEGRNDPGLLTSRRVAQRLVRHRPSHTRL